MNDTSPKITAYYDRMIMERSPQDRLRMGCSMFDTAKEIVRSSILEADPHISAPELKKKIFLRFYGQDFEAEQKIKIIEALTLNT